jgi:BirA family biotin operon repressor/biotin-[acetyl-CoA-carboxylase] ligase
MRNRELQRALIGALAEGGFHSGTALGRELGVSRAAVWKWINKLIGHGLDVERVPGRGYRLAAPLDLLDERDLRRELNRHGVFALDDIEVLSVVDSTNQRLLEKVPGLPAGAVAACLAECQTAGRGRRGRAWVSPFGASLYLSMAWHFDALPPDIGALALVAGVAAVDALRESGFDGIELKWPNDLVHDGRKLGGVLANLGGQPGGECCLVAGIGINVAMPRESAGNVGQPFTDLATIGAVEPGLRSRLAAGVIASWLCAVERFKEHGFAAFGEAWRQYDAVAGRRVEMHLPDETLAGTAVGVDGQGALRVLTDRGERRFLSGDVSLRFGQ